MPTNGRGIRIKPGITFVQIPEKELVKPMAAAQDLQNKRYLSRTSACGSGYDYTKCKATGQMNDFTCEDMIYH